MCARTRVSSSFHMMRYCSSLKGQDKHHTEDHPHHSTTDWVNAGLKKQHRTSKPKITLQSFCPPVLQISPPGITPCLNHINISQLTPRVKFKLKWIMSIGIILLAPVKPLRCLLTKQCQRATHVLTCKLIITLFGFKKIRKNCTTLLSITPSHVGKSGAELLFNPLLEIQGIHPSDWGIRIFHAYFKEVSHIWNNCSIRILIYPNFNAPFIHNILKFYFLLIWNYSTLSVHIVSIS